MNNEADERAFEEVIDDLVVMARSKPEHKYILVDGINKLGHIGWCYWRWR
jgi:magnesium-transporting ATPase (P-type)